MPTKAKYVKRYRKRAHVSRKRLGGRNSLTWGVGANARSIASKPKGPTFNYSKYNKTIGPNLLSCRFLPQRMFTTHRFGQQVSMFTNNVTGLSENPTVFYLNDLFTPQASVSLQPMGRDQMAVLYKHYLVYKVEIQLRPVLVSAQDACAVGRVQGSQSVGSGFTMNAKYPREFQDQGNCVIIPGNLNGAGDVWKQEFYIADIEGVSRTHVFNDLYYGAAVGASPNRRPILEVVCASFNGTTSTNCELAVDIIYHAVWTNPVNFFQS